MGLVDILTKDQEHLVAIAQEGDALLRRRLLSGNRVSPLCNGESAYPVMLEAIESAEASVALSTYMFADDPTGLLFVERLAEAVARNVEVRVIVDSFGAVLSWPPIQKRLRHTRIRFASFGPLWRLGRTSSRYHRKILIVDGRVGFVGGMNIRQHHLLNAPSSCPTADLHYRVEGPVVSELQATFCADWHTCSGEVLGGERWFPFLTSVDKMLVRMIATSPSNTHNARALILIALAHAKDKISIVTPYFFPDLLLVDALKNACLRGVRVAILIPRDTWRPFRWAANTILRELLRSGCGILLTESPFDHSKLFLVDNAWGLIGSSNWDTLSLLRNYELDMETYDPSLVKALAAIVRSKVESAEELTLGTLESLRAYEKIRDGLAHLLYSYL